MLGFGLGLLVAAQLGPMSLLLIRSTLRGGVAVGLAIGAGIAVVDAFYAAAGAAGAASLLALEPLHLALGLAGGAVLAWLGARTLWSAFRVRMGGEAAKAIYKRRAATVETVNAHLKQHGMNAMLVRGLKKTRCVALWCALAYNVMHFGAALLA